MEQIEEDIAEPINNVIKSFVTNYKYIQKPNHVRCIQLKPGLKLYYSNKEQCLKTSEELTNAGFKNRVAYNCDGNFWSIYVLDKTNLLSGKE